MLFKKENYNKIKSIIWDLNESYSYYNNSDLLDFRYLELDETNNKVYEIHKVFDSDDFSSRKLLVNERFDVTIIFSGLIAYIE